MPRKVFLSFLGATPYQETLYLDEGQDKSTVKPTRFIQEALLSKLSDSFGSGDQIFIFTTAGAKHNWESENHPVPRNQEPIVYESLQSRLQHLYLKAEVESVSIPEGKTREELWEIFETVFGKLEKDDILYFDITHGFRPLPMFNMVLINYAKLLLDVEVVGIFYGNFEARYEDAGKFYSPIWNLLDFQVLQDWTTGANIFLNTGNALTIAEQIAEIGYTDLKQGLQNFSKHMLVNRGMEIYDGKELIKIRNALKDWENEDRQMLDKPLAPILAKIKGEFDCYEKESPLNGFLAVKWAIQNGLVQQGATLLEEAVTTFILCDIGQQKMLNHETKRSKASAALTIGPEIPFKYTEVPSPLENNDAQAKAKREKAQENKDWEEVYVPIIRALPYKKKLAECVNSIKNSIRNDINHAGFRESPRTYEELCASLTKRYNEIRKILENADKLFLPEL